MAEEFRLVMDDVSSSLWELVDKELAVKRQNKEQIVSFEANDICQTNIMDTQL